MPKRPTNLTRDAEGTTRLPHVRKALKAGLLKAPKADKPRGPWRPKDTGRRRRDSD